MSDVLDILEVDRGGAASSEINREKIIGPQRVAKRPGAPRGSRRPEGINRELYALLYSDNKEHPPLFPTEDVNKGYKQTKAKLGMRRVRPWRWTPFTNPARSDGAVLHHWRRVADEDKEYAFAKFNKKVDVVSFTDQEYQRHLQADGWSKAATEHLFDLCRRFDLRFIVMQDRWDRAKYADRSVEDLKGRYYSICSTLNKLRAEPGQPQTKEFVYDAAHERRRKQQLKRLFSRSPKQIEEEQHLLAELRKIEARKRERERKTQDLQKLINSADTEHRRLHKTPGTVKKKVVHVGNKPPRDRLDSASSGAGDAGGSIKFPDLRGSGVSLRSQRMKLPASIGQKKAKAIEQLVQELGIEMSPMPTEEISSQFNELRNDMLLLYELKMGLSSCEFELQTLKHQYEALAPGKTLDIPSSIAPSGLDINRPKTISQVLDIHSSQGTPTRKRKAALEQSKVLHKIKART
ncbi:DNA methyltransferase 1-associated protein 1-like isoform X2 [Amphibalanus amphitrite]|uniref:DNA methyltransferase 1-associated protein 1-like isoform X1 n=1 Tax=Amphibalanus amphitrite TaxID=1232801 RepID=UPI001C902B6B|nr:DNA methyltransferase 1-associated protein 1-like isoform X1 [Amphibalanus amphitrite]XP_043208295.1 DNA methyltransferase 1-associated protein 1-like isoform X1 [Amphibalanus amphitrite]XP_043208297.1 DNA methyltransferase 1-associated protein 1-like isoform X2 [Amphibalanus amphitrite]